MQNLEQLLVGNGNLIVAARRKGKSLDRAERSIILRAREKASAAGYSRTTINALEMEGEGGRVGIGGMPIDLVFIGNQDAAFHGLTFRLYNIVGDHPLNQSTVTAGSLFMMGLFPLDLSFFGLVKEFLKEKFMDVVWFTHSFVRKISTGGK